MQLQIIATKEYTLTPAKRPRKRTAKKDITQYS
jgi:hypothetical protein